MAALQVKAVEKLTKVVNTGGDIGTARNCGAAIWRCMTKRGVSPVPRERGQGKVAGGLPVPRRANGAAGRGRARSLLCRRSSNRLGSVQIGSRTMAQARLSAAQPSANYRRAQAEINRMPPWPSATRLRPWLPYPKHLLAAHESRSRVQRQVVAVDVLGQDA